MRILRALGLGAALLLLGACKEELYSGLTEREANQIIAALMEIGIPASKEPGAEGIAVHVEESRFPEAIALLESRGLPEATFENFGEVFAREGIVDSPMAERARFMYALSQELSETVAGIDGVLSARVHVVLPETDMLGEEFQPSAASVMIHHAPDVDVSGFTAQIKNLVANSIEGLVYDKVTVVAVPTGVARAEGVAAPILHDILGVWVHPGSVGRLWTLLGLLSGLVVMVGLAAGAMALGRWRGRPADVGFDEA